MRIEFQGDGRYALIGCPLGHSLSPLIHNELFRLRGTRGAYSLMEIPAERLVKEYRETLSALDGFNVTIPHKTNILPLLDELSPRAALFGAVNTVEIKNGRSKGYNTDCSGFLRSLDMAGIALQGRVLICGCGGVSRMFAYESALAGAAITLGVRESSLEKAAALQQELQKKLGITANIATLSSLNGGYDLVINGTPAGMAPHTDSCPVSEAVVKQSGAVFDAVYNPAETRLIKLAKENGVKCVNGLPMLVLQAAAAQEIWLEVAFTEEELKTVMQHTQKELDLR